MKRKILLEAKIKETAFLLIFLLALGSSSAFSQVCKNPHIANYDERSTAYMTTGGNGDPNNLIPWSTAAIWNLCEYSGPNPGVPPDPMGDVNQIYLQISANDYVIADNLKYKNNVTLVVCGYLEVGNFEDEETDDGVGTFNRVHIEVCEGGTLKMKTLDVKNIATLNINGTFIVDNIIGQQLNSGNCIYGSGVIMNTSGTGDVNIHQFQYGTTGDDCAAGQSNFGGILPIELLSFTPQVKPDQIELNWTTGTEINNDYFTIERSRDLFGWEILGYENGAGNSSTPIHYSFSDLTPLDGLAYYRLKQTDFDGKFKYYGPIAAHYDLGMEGLEFKVMKQFTKWVIAVPNDGIYQVELYNLSGQRLISEKVSNTLSVPAPDGAVVIRVTDGLARSVSRVVM